MQHVVKYTDLQKYSLFQSRRTYITDMARVARRRRELLQQLQSAPEAHSISFTESGTSYSSVDNITQQLQDCVKREDELFRQYLWGPKAVVRVWV